MNDSKPPISAFDEICQITQDTMRGMEIEVLLDLLQQATREFHRSSLTIRSLITVITEKTKIPLSAISTNESEKLLHLEEEMRKRVIGQEEAVGAVANALRRARAEIRSGKRPIANFLFLGPTGVGKTELTKALASFMFNDEKAIVRIDMSEYMEKHAVADRKSVV